MLESIHTKYPKIHNLILIQNWKLISLTYFNPMFHFYTPWKRQKNFGLNKMG